MVQCNYCKKSLGLFAGKVSIEVDGGKIFLCKTCVDNWKHYHKKEVVSKLCQQGAPKILFVVPNALYRDPNDIYRTLAGPIVFTDRAVFFFEFSSAQNYTYNDSGLSVFGLFGAIGGLVEGLLIYRDLKAQEPSAQAADYKRLPDFDEIAKAAKDLIVIPRETIAEINVRGGGWTIGQTQRLK